MKNIWILKYLGDGHSVIDVLYFSSLNKSLEYIKDKYSNSDTNFDGIRAVISQSRYQSYVTYRFKELPYILMKAPIR